MQPPIGIHLQQTQAKIIESQIVKTEVIDHGYRVSHETHTSEVLSSPFLFNVSLARDLIFSPAFSNIHHEIRIGYCETRRAFESPDTDAILSKISFLSHAFSWALQLLTKLFCVR